MFMVSLAGQKLLSLIRSHLFSFFFFLISITLVGGPKKTLLKIMSENVQPMFSSRIFILSCLTYRSLIPLSLFLLVWCQRMF